MKADRPLMGEKMLTREGVEFPGNQGSSGIPFFLSEPGTPHASFQVSEALTGSRAPTRTGEGESALPLAKESWTPPYVERSLCISTQRSHRQPP